MARRFTWRRSLAYGTTLLLFGGSVVSCSSTDEPEIERSTDTGTLCLRPEVDGATSIVAYFFDRCLSCNMVPTSSCNATVTDDQVTVSTVLEVEIKDTPRLCPASCAFASALCGSLLPSPGEYRVNLGGKSATVALPLTAAVAPYGDRACQPMVDPE
jgi:hypothetical protein